jgi:predicted RNA-binding Zn-ribbon protein involved in translation (DUF1610 family)
MPGLACRNLSRFKPVGEIIIGIQKEEKANMFGLVGKWGVLSPHGKLGTTMGKLIEMQKWQQELAHNAKLDSVAKGKRFVCSVCGNRLEIESWGIETRCSACRQAEKNAS